MPVQDMTDEEFEQRFNLEMQRQAPRIAAEEQAVERLGDEIGYGRLMQAAETVWRRKAIANGTPGGEHTTGPCASMMVTCPHREDSAEDNHPEWFSYGSCDWCCGAGRVTTRVAKAMRQKQSKAK